jgi:SAM-dependent methyltransferase
VAHEEKEYQERSKLEVLFGPEIWEEIAGKTVIDFGCGTGTEAVTMACRGAALVEGIDIRSDVLDQARGAARKAGVADRCQFGSKATVQADLVISVDAFEHFADPGAILAQFRSMVKVRGTVLISFGPPWYHPRGGHLFSVFPWAHLVFSEKALLRWRAHFKADGATRFHEVDGGLNQMTIRRFCQLVHESPFRFDHFEVVPIRKLRFLNNSVTREYFTSLVRCRLIAC